MAEQCPTLNCERVEPGQEVSLGSLGNKQKDSGIWELTVSLLGVNDDKEGGNDLEAATLR